MDDKTRNYYKNRAPELSGKYENVEKAYNGLIFMFFGPPGEDEKYIDIGSGTGRDLNWFIEQGYNITGVEPVKEMTEVAMENNPGLKGRIIEDNLPELEKLQTPDHQNQYTGILISAVIQHVPRNNITNSLRSVKNLLKAGGKLLISMPGKRPNIGEDERDKTGRLFVRYTPSEIEEELINLGFKKIFQEETADAIGRSDITWVNMGFKLVNG